MTRSDAEFDGDVMAIRQRAAELNRHLGISLPVYLLVTKVDLVAGFREYFDDLDAAGRRQVWGTTFALEDSRTGRALRRRNSMRCSNASTRASISGSRQRDPGAAPCCSASRSSPR
jgi:type VI protein secretion system component VasK